MILLLRDFSQQMSLLRRGKWRSEKFMGTELKAKTVGLVGCGAIGRLVAEKLIAFGVKDMICFDPFLDQESLIPRHITKCELEEVFRKSDIITFHLPLNSETRHEVDKKRLSLMKKGAFIVNTSRGAVINELDLIDAIQSGALGGAALDVFENEPDINSRLLDFPNVVLTPHVGSFSMESDREMSVEAVLNFLQALDSEGIKN
jgi:D-3-phosphoglycerate dehydrogenase